MAHSRNDNSSRRWRKWTSKNWRSIMFLLILSAALTAGFYYKFNSDPGEAPSVFRNHAPQYLNIFLTLAQIEQNPTVNVTVNLERDNSELDPNAPSTLNTSGLSTFSEFVNIELDSGHPIPQGRIAIVSSDEPSDPNSIKDRPSQEFVSIDPIETVGKTSRGQFESAAVAAFDDVPIFWEGDGSIYGHLPSVNIIQWSNGNVPNIVAEFNKKSGQIVKSEIDFSGQPYGSPPAFAAVSRADGTDVFWEIASFTVTEVIEGIGPVLANDQIDYMNPPTTDSSFNYQWSFTGCCGIEPTFKLTDPETIDSQNKDAFISGIAFGVAGAAAIAVVQELPKEINFSRHKRQSKPAGSEKPMST